MTPIRAGVVGVGHLGYHHARNYAALEGVQLIGVVDADPAKAQKAAQDFHTAIFPDAAALADAGAQAVSVAVPTVAHHAVAMTLLEKGVDVLVEKPIAATIAEGRDLVEAAERLGRILQVGHIERFNGAVVALLEAVKSPRFIECHRLSPFPMRGHDVSVVHDLMIHDLEILLALDRSGVAAIDAIGVPVLSPCEDIANVRITFQSGCVANLTASRVSMEKMRKIRIFESDSYLSTDYSEQDVIVYRRKPGALTPDMNPMELIAIDSLNVTKDEPLKRELAAFVDCVRNGAPPVVSGRDGLAALELATAIVDQIRRRLA